MNITLDVTPQFIEQLDQVIKDSVTKAIKDIRTEERVLTKQQAAEFYQVSIPTLDSFMHIGLPYFKEGQTVRFLHSELVDWMRSNMTLIESKRR